MVNQAKLSPLTMKIDYGLLHSTSAPSHVWCHTSICNPTAFALQLCSLSPELQQHFPAPLGQDFPFCSHSLTPESPNVVVIVGFPRSWLWPSWELSLPLPGCAFCQGGHCTKLPGQAAAQDMDSVMSSDLRELWAPEKNQIVPSCTGSDWDGLLSTGASMVLQLGFVTKPVLIRHQYFVYCCTRLSHFLHSAHHQWADVHLHLWLLTGKLHFPQTCLKILCATTPAVPSTYLKQKTYKIQAKTIAYLKATGQIQY